MTTTNNSEATKKLAFGFIMENIEYRKKCLYIQEIIALGKENNIWWKALSIFLDRPVNLFPLKAFSKN